MFFAPSVVALVASILPLAAALAVPSGYTSVTVADLSPLAATSNFLIASERFGTELNIGYNVTGNGNAVILYTAQAAQATNQQVECVQYRVHTPLTCLHLVDSK
jgi:hypothetical protein